MLKEKILQKQKTIGTHINLCDPAVSKIAGCAGYDFVWVDLEHSGISYQTLLTHIFALRSTGTPVIVRVPQDDVTAAKKVLEMGVDGIIFPMIRSAAQARACIQSTLYPPQGNRGFGPMNAIDYGFKDVADYVHNDHNRLCRFIQIEHKDAIADLDAILQLPYIDGYIFGANDLSGSYGRLGDVFCPEITDVIGQTTQRLHAAGKYAGLSTGDIRESTLRHWHSLGVDMLSAGADYDFLREGYRANAQTLSKIFK